MPSADLGDMIGVLFAKNVDFIMLETQRFGSTVQIINFSNFYLRNNSKAFHEVDAGHQNFVAKICQFLSISLYLLFSVHTLWYQKATYTNIFFKKTQNSKI